MADSKKRVASTQLTRDDPDPDDNETETEVGSFKKASEEVMATRRIVKVKRAPQQAAPSANPFSGIRLVPPTANSASQETKTENKNVEENKETEKISLNGDDANETSQQDVAKNGEAVELENENKNEEKSSIATIVEGEEVKENDEDKSSAATVEDSKDTENSAKIDEEVKESDGSASKEDLESKTEGQKETGIEDDSKADEKERSPVQAGSLSAFGQLSSGQNAFQGLAGTGFSSSSFSFGSGPTEGSAPISAFSGAGSAPISAFSSAGSVFGSKPDSSLKEVPVETGEENEKTVFTADTVLFEFLQGGWKERGKGEVKLNLPVSDKAKKPRLVMRTKGNYRLVLNANLFPDMALKDMDKKGVTFACLNSAGEGDAGSGLSTFALKFRDEGIRDEFSRVVSAHKGEKEKVEAAAENTESSPKKSTGAAQFEMADSKKRVASTQLTRDDPDPDDNETETEVGSFQKASEEIMATQRIVKVKCAPQQAGPSANPFSGIHLVPPTANSGSQETKTENKNVEENKETEKISLNGNDANETSQQNAKNGEAVELENENKNEDKSSIATIVEGEEVKENDEHKSSVATVEDSKEAENTAKIDEEVKESDGSASKEDLESKTEGQKETGIEDDSKADEKERSPVQAGSLSAFGQLSSGQNAFQGLAGTGFSSSSFSFGSGPTEGSAPISAFSGAGSAPISAFSSAGSVFGSKPDSSLKEVPVETGEENEKTVFTADTLLFEFLQGGWKERGKGEVKLNLPVSDKAKKPRLVMRTKGNYRLVLNANLFPDMALKDMDKKGVTFACLNSAGEGDAGSGLSTFALKFRDEGIRDEFSRVVSAHKGEKEKVEAAAENTESSPKKFSE